MGNETKTKPRAKKADNVDETPVLKEEHTEKASNVTEAKNTVKKAIPKDIDLNQLVVVRNGYQGKLVYKSPRTHEKFVWPEFGAEQMIELLELRNAKNTWKKYFINNWFMFDEEYAWVIDYLGMTQYYKHALPIDKFDDLFEKSPDEIERCVAMLSDGQKSSVRYRARQLIADGEIDSNKAIAALERSLGVDLVER